MSQIATIHLDLAVHVKWSSNQCPADPDDIDLCVTGIDIENIELPDIPLRAVRPYILFDLRDEVGRMLVEQMPVRA